MGQKQSQTKVVTDLKKNRMYITFASNIKPRDIEKAYTDIRFGVADLQAGFDVINDLSNANLGHLSGIPIFKKISDYLQSSEVGKVVRVLGKKSIIYGQITRLSKKTCLYKPIYVETIEEAELLLEEDNSV